MGSFNVTIAPPCADQWMGVGQDLERMSIQALAPHPPNEAFSEAVPHGFCRPRPRPLRARRFHAAEPKAPFVEWSRR